jgi:hypothetical protein
MLFNSHENILDLQVPFFSYKLTGDVSPFAWNTTTTPQKGLLGRTITYPRGFVLGGSSTHSEIEPLVRSTRVFKSVQIACFGFEAHGKITTGGQMLPVTTVGRGIRFCHT